MIGGQTHYKNGLLAPGVQSLSIAIPSRSASPSLYPGPEKQPRPKKPKPQWEDSLSPLLPVPAVGPDKFLQELPLSHLVTPDEAYMVAASTGPSESEPDLHRLDCSEVSGTEYVSHPEREWYLTNCVKILQATYSRTYSTDYLIDDAIEEQFRAGYLDGGGPVDMYAQVLRMVSCESNWDPYVISPDGLYHGLMQFDMPTWRESGGGDWTSPYWQGHHTAYLFLTSYPGNRWPVCFYR